MAISSIASGAPAAVYNPAPQAAAARSSEMREVGPEMRADNDRDDRRAAAAAPAPAPASSVNLNGQVVGTRVNVSA